MARFALKLWVIYIPPTPCPAPFRVLVFLLSAIPAFRKRLLVLFPDSVDQEFTDACKRLSKQGLLHLQKFDNELGGFCDYHDERDDVAFFGANSNVFCLRASVQSQKYFKQLSTLIDAPSGFKR